MYIHTSKVRKHNKLQGLKKVTEESESLYRSRHLYLKSLHACIDRVQTGGCGVRLSHTRTACMTIVYIYMQE